MLSTFYLKLLFLIAHIRVMPSDGVWGSIIWACIRVAPVGGVLSVVGYRQPP